MFTIPQHISLTPQPLIQRFLQSCVEENVYHFHCYIKSGFGPSIEHQHFKSLSFNIGQIVEFNWLYSHIRRRKITVRYAYVKVHGFGNKGYAYIYTTPIDLWQHDSVQYKLSLIRVP